MIFGGPVYGIGGASDGDDYILGGHGNDTITGGSGDDFIDGGSGDDSMGALPSANSDIREHETARRQVQ